MSLLIQWLVARMARSTPHDELAQQYSLLLMAARRCAYDLSHAVDEMPELVSEDFYAPRSRRWLQIFTPDGMKIYRHELHKTISELELRVGALERQLKENNIEPSGD